MSNLCFLARGRIIFAAAVTASILLTEVSGAAEGSARVIDFRSDKFSLGSLDGQEGWNASEGTMVTGGIRQIVTLPVSLPPNWASRRFELPSLQAGESTIVDFFLKPAAGQEDEGAALVLAGEARIVFEREEDQGAVFALGPDGEWIDSGYRFPVSLETGEAEKWIRLTLWIESDFSSFDLHIDSAPFLSKLALPQPAVSGEIEFSLRGTAQGAVHLGDLLVGDEEGLLERINELFHAADGGEGRIEWLSFAEARRNSSLSSFRQQARTSEEVRNIIEQLRGANLRNRSRTLSVFSPMERSDLNR